MKKQSGFTLIELLLVLAIIGIISAIAIPALLGQRARARDKASISNMQGRMGDLVGQYDRLKESGQSIATIVTNLQTYLNQSGAKDYNPWNPSLPAFDQATAVTQGTDRTASTAAATAANAAIVVGQPIFVLSPPAAAIAATSTASAVPAGAGYIAGAVLINGTVNGSNKVTKVSAIE